MKKSLRELLERIFRKVGDVGRGVVRLGILNKVMVRDGMLHYHVQWTVRRWASEAAWLAGEASYLTSSFERNLLLNEGINELWTLVCSGSGTKFDNTNAYSGVGDSNAAAVATQTGLQAATNKLYKAMDGGFPTYGTLQKATFRSTYASGDANFAWEEFTIGNGSSDTGKNLNRKVSAQGTKVSGQVWELTTEVTLS